MTRLPDFFLVGASKAGTTAICNALEKHPEICFSEEKEPNFFSDFDMSLEDIPNEQILSYLDLFKSGVADKILGEGSVKYLNSENALYWIRKYIPSSKIIIVLRNPVHRIVSLYEMYERLRVMKMRKEEAFEDDSYLVRQCILYEHVLRYIEAFGKKQVLIVIFEDFISNPSKEFHRICRFLGIQEIKETLFECRNKGGVPKFKAIRFLTNRAMIQYAKKILPRSKQAAIDNFVKSILFRKYRLTNSQEEKLEKLFYSDVCKIGKLIDRDLLRIWKFRFFENFSS